MRRWCVLAGIPVAMALGSAAMAQTPIGVRLEGSGRPGRELVLKASAPLTVQGFLFANRWVVDLPGVVYRGSVLRLRPSRTSELRDIRIGQFKPTVMRLVFDFKGRSACAVPVRREPLRGGRGTLLIFDLAHLSAGPRVAAFEKTSPDDSAFPRHPLPPVPPPEGVTLRRTGSGWIVRVAAASPISYDLERRGHRDRLYLDVRGAQIRVPSSGALAEAGLPATLAVTSTASHSERLELRMTRPLRYQAWLADGDRAIILDLSPPQQQFVPHASWARITVDPGHGGPDPGTIGPGGLDEKAVTLALATRLERLMVDRGLNVQLTRISDTGVGLRPRVEMGDEFRSNVFVSIHMNHSDDPAIHGIETYYFTPQSRQLADDIQRHLVRSLGATDRGVRRDNFVVVKYTQIPACLVEVGYLSNPEEERLLDSPAYQERAAKGILAGIDDYLHHHPPDLEARR